MNVPAAQAAQSEPVYPSEQEQAVPKLAVTLLAGQTVHGPPPKELLNWPTRQAKHGPASKPKSKKPARQL